MAVNKRTLKAGVSQHKPTISTDGGQVVSESYEIHGAYSELLTKQRSLWLQNKQTILRPEAGGQGVLTVTKEVDLPGNSESNVARIETIEVIWQELRRAVELHPYFSELTKPEIASVKAAAEDRNPALITGASQAYELYDYLVAGVTEYSTGVPVVRRTTNQVKKNEGGGSAWIRDEPPVAVPGDWEWLKTADERRREGKSYTQIEEWTAATVWDPILYPATS